MLVWISAASCTVGYILMLLAVSASIIVSTRGTSDIGVTWLWVGLLAFLGWAMFVAPWVRLLVRFKLFVQVRWAWLGWALLAAIAFLALTVWFMGTAAFQILYLPAIMGALDGLAFSFILRWVQTRQRAKLADSQAAAGGGGSIRSGSA